MFKIPSDKDITIVLNDATLAPVFACDIKTPFVYVAYNGDSQEHARLIFENCGLKLGEQVFTVTTEELYNKIPVLPENIKLTVNEKVGIKKFGERLADFGYLRMSKIEAESEYSVRGDIIDIWQREHPHPLRIMFWGDTIEAIKLIDAGNFSGIKNLDTCEIAPLPEHCTVDEWRTVFQTLLSKTQTFAFDNGEGLLRVFFAMSGDSTPKHKTARLEIKTAPIANYFSSLSMVIPEIIWNVNTRGKTVLVFVGNSRACEKYMDTKGVPYVISTPDNFTPNTINIIKRPLGVSFELIDQQLVIYSLHTPKNNKEQIPYEREYDPEEPQEFTLPEIGTLVYHDQHGLGRYLGIKTMHFADTERNYIVLQYDNGAFVYLPPDRTHELVNYYGPPRRLDRI